MGQDIESITYTREQRQRFRQKVHLCLDVFERMLAYSQFDFERPMTGMEIELNLTGSDFRPKMDNALVLELIAENWYLAFNRAWPPSPIDDQNLAGGIMWGAGDLISLVILSVFFVQWFKSREEEDDRFCGQTSYKQHRCKRPVLNFEHRTYD